MKIRVEQLNPIVGDIFGNTGLILNAYKKAEEENCDLLLLPELVVPGYPPMDLLEVKRFIKTVEDANQTLIKTTGKTAFLFGSVTTNKTGTGRPIFNSALLAQHGQLLFTQHKSLLPTYDVFDEFRYFEPAKLVEPYDFNGLKMGITICEDLWYNYNEKQYHIYDINPAEELRSQGIDVMLNLSASPFGKQKPDSRYLMLKHHAESLKCPVLYANQVGANTEIVFDGDSMAINSDGTLTQRTNLFQVDSIDLLFEKSTKTIAAISQKKEALTNINERMFHALVLGIKDYLSKTSISEKVILGLSGGIDSALTAVIAVEALGSDRVIGITMPSEFSSDGSINDSIELAKNLGIACHTIPIKSIYNSYLKTLEPFFSDTPFNVAEENLQSRARGMILMAMSNKFGYMLLNTGNKSEMAVGYCTLYGDMAGGLSVISDLYKTEVYALSNWINNNYFQKEVIPQNTLTKPPSAELRPNQKDTDSLPGYDILDAVLKLYIEDQITVAEISDRGFNPDTVSRIVKMVDNNEYKRRQAPPGLRISNKAFGIGRRIPIVQKWTSQQ